MLLIKFAGTVALLFLGVGPLPILGEAVAFEGFVVFPEAVVLVEFAVRDRRFLDLTGAVRADVFPFASPSLFARFAHVLPQYGCTVAPSLYLGFFLQCFRR